MWLQSCGHLCARATSWHVCGEPDVLEQYHVCFLGVATFHNCFAGTVSFLFASCHYLYKKLHFVANFQLKVWGWWGGHGDHTIARLLG